VHNAVDVSRYTFAPQAGSTAPLVFLGRIEHIKGTHVAIDVARRAGRQLVLAGNVPPAHQTYFDEQVRPHIDGKAVVYLGPVDDARKNALLSRAAALLMPVLWEEPFGIVMAEALACGGLSRRECRDSAEQRFSQAALVDGYTQVYRDVLARAGSRARVPREATS
jgi:glycosyltransferase involved in cell wall biosynthesis